MSSLFLPPSSFVSSEIIITDEKAHYLTHVLRLKKGQYITLLDGQGRRYHARCVSFSKKEVRVVVVNVQKIAPHSSLSLTLAQSIVRSSKMDLIIEKATELGVNEIIPLITEHTQIRKTSKITRWRAIAMSAAQQSSRIFVPEIHAPLHFRDFLCKGYKGIMFWEKESSGRLKEILKSLRPCASIAVVTGPEGGFTQAEVEMARAYHFLLASLGSTILKAETAAITALSIIQYELGNIR
jgi:16S rRNA (uracil1498-N3)-methyltransferase